jgi:hypothetical protein
MLIARLTAVKLLPSPGSALVTMMRLPFLMGAAPRTVAFLINGRLMTGIRATVRPRGIGRDDSLRRQWPGRVNRRASSERVRALMTTGADPSSNSLWAAMAPRAAT